MKNKHDRIWECLLCSKHTGTLHEIFYGKFRKKSIEYSLQCPICPDDHDFVHLKKNIDTYTHEQFVITCKYSYEEKLNYIIQNYLCEIMKLPNRYIIKQALENSDTAFLDIVAQLGELAIQRLEI